MEILTKRLDCRDRLVVAIREAREAVADGEAKEVELDELIALARKITPASRPPPGILFTVDRGPAEALPIRFRLPYPTLDEMRMSLVATEGNKWKGDLEIPKPSEKRVIEDDDDYNEDF